MHVSFGKHWGESFLRRKIIFFHFWTLSEKVSAFYRHFFDGLVKTAFCMCIISFRCKRVFSRDNSHLLWILGDGILSISWERDGGVIKIAFYVSLGTLWGKSYFRRKFFPDIFGHWAKKFRLLLAIFFGRVCQNCVLRVHMNSLRQTSFFSRKKYFFSSSLDFGWQTFVYLIRKNRWNSRNHILSFRRNNVRKNFPAGKFVFPYHCRPMSKNFQEFFVEKIPAASSKLRSKCQGKHFVEKKCLEKKFLSLADIERKIVGFL